jgi:membrane protein YqaA with SNARE-associated domain
MQQAPPSPEPATAGPAPPAPPRRALHRRMYDWMLTFAHRPYATPALFLFSLTEAIFFPIPPIVLQVPMSLERRSKSWYYALVLTVASVLGGLVGYGIGWAFSDFAEGLFGPNFLETVHEWSGNAWLMSAGVIAIHPFKLFTIAAGFLGVPLVTFLIAAIVGRAVLFFSIAALLWFFGPPVRVFIDRYFNLLCIAFGLLVAALVVLMSL